MNIAVKTREYAFDVKLWAVVRVRARNKNDAVKALTDILDAAEPSDGFIEGFNEAAPDGVEISEVSLAPEEGDENLEPFEIDGEEVA